MPSVSDPGYFCTNGMSESRHDSPFANSGLVVTIEPEETGSTHPLAGRPLPAAGRAAGLPGGRTSYKAPIQWARDFLAGRPSRGKIPTSYRRGALPIDLAPLPARPVMEALKLRAAGDGPTFRRAVPPRRHAHRPRVARQLAGPHHPRPTDPQSPAVPGSTPAARGPATPAGSSARPSMACGRRGRSSRPMQIRLRDSPIPRRPVPVHSPRDSSGF